MHSLLRQLLALGLPQTDYALFGSGPILLRGWIDDVSDLDVIARGGAWDLASKLGEARRLEDLGVEIVAIGEGITVGREWAIGNFDIDQLIDGAELIAGVRCVQLEHVIAYKRLADRPKDRRHLAVIEGKIGRRSFASYRDRAGPDPI